MRFFPFLFLIWCVGTPFLYAQISDDFSDGDFTQNPGWQGDIADFIVNPANELQLNAAAAGSSALLVPLTVPDSTRWSFDLRMPFAPSVTNRLRIFLQAGDANLDDANGYFLEIGENGSDDALRFFRKDAGTETLLATGVAGAVGSSPVDIRVFVKKSGSGAWSVEMSSGGGPAVLQFEVTDDTYPGGPNQFFGFQCFYTASRVDQFFFDNILIEEDLPDTTPPSLISGGPVDANTIELVFDELLETASAEDVGNYEVSGIGNPAAVTLLPDSMSVSLSLAAPLTSGQTFTVTASQIADRNGNAAADQSVEFFFFQPDVPEFFDVLVNEFMADPSPGVGLPEVEWIELYNRSDKFINTADLTIRDATSAAIPIPEFILDPGANVVLSTASGADSLLPFAADTVLALALPSLNNGADDIVLERASDGAPIDRVSFSSDWHADSLQREGGWTLERINPNLPCKGRSNWQSCPILPGGTPGAANASLDDSPDTTPPQLLEAFTNGPQELLLQFSEELDVATAENPGAYSLDPSVGVGDAMVNSDDITQVVLTLTANLQTGVFYQLSISDEVKDCSGNGASGPSVTVLLPDVPELFDVIVNEVMSDPAPNVGLPEFEWIELYNRSDKLINLSSLTLRDENSDPKALPNFLLAPGEFAVISAPEGVDALADFTDPGTLVAFDLPSLNNSADLIILERLSDGERIERLSYNANWHEDPGKRDGGWSLERINPTLPCLGRENWQSCPVLPGGTVGRGNASLAIEPDTVAPVLLDAFPTDAQTLELLFSEGLDGVTATTPSAYTLDPAIGIASVSINPDILNLVTLRLDAPLQEGVLYQLSVGMDVRDCSGNPMQDAPFTIGLPVDPGPDDVVLNEIMFNAAPNGSRYVELFNTSDKTFDLRTFYLANFFEGADVKPVDLRRLFLPGDYIVLCADAEDVRSRFQNIRPEKVIEMDFPRFDDREGNAAVIWTDAGVSITLDSFDYEDDLHNAIFSVSDREGKSLERIRANGATNDPQNWTSASDLITGDFGTPTLPNSQAAAPLDPDGSKNIRLLNKRLSPDQDGFEDFLEIEYDLPESGYIGEAVIFESGGQPIKRIQRQALLGTSGTLRWDGETDEGTPARPGIYILYFELFSPTGDVEQFKESFAVVKRF